MLLFSKCGLVFHWRKCGLLSSAFLVPFRNNNEARRPQLSYQGETHKERSNLFLKKLPWTRLGCPLLTQSENSILLPMAQVTIVRSWDRYQPFGFRLSGSHHLLTVQEYSKCTALPACSGNLTGRKQWNSYCLLWRLGFLRAGTDPRCFLHCPLL